ncbi:MULTISPECIES: histidine phosphatase family protein [unclassified Acidovorax]|uniref:histidine phosphatase family protein n=1 Tax=unclassified Acidovorax TaxID=2684926 RepID=UPI000857852F|nr:MULTISPECIES: histidine phosphatase family protein [unclassified Acidovorax]AOG22606.1 histidine phosphatase super family protein [Acidovorax sp. RAC01]MDH4462415.1 histidine phosphatase family protein [Acidovorax sp.]
MPVAAAALIRTLQATAFLAVALACPATGAQQPGFREKPVDQALLAEMRGGGFVLYMRHSTSDSARPDRAPTVDLADCNTQRPLSDEGRKQASTLGQNLLRARIPVGEVVHSPYCRTRETAQLAFAGQPQLLRQEPLLAYSANLPSDQKPPLLAAVRHLLSTPVAPGTNRVIIAHAPNLADLMGYFVKPEGTFAVFRPLGASQFEYLGSIPPPLWGTLLP